MAEPISMKFNLFILMFWVNTFFYCSIVLFFYTYSLPLKIIRQKQVEDIIMQQQYSFLTCLSVNVFFLFELLPIYIVVTQTSIYFGKRVRFNCKSANKTAKHDQCSDIYRRDKRAVLHKKEIFADPAPTRLFGLKNYLFAFVT